MPFEIKQGFEHHVMARSRSLDWLQTSLRELRLR